MTFRVKQTWRRDGAGISLPYSLCRSLALSLARSGAKVQTVRARSIGSSTSARSRGKIQGFGWSRLILSPPNFHPCQKVNLVSNGARINNKSTPSDPKTQKTSSTTLCRNGVVVSFLTSPANSISILIPPCVNLKTKCARPSSAPRIYSVLVLPREEDSLHTQVDTLLDSARL